MTRFENNLVNLVSLSNSLKKKFVKDYNLPVDVFAEPMFTDALKLLDGQFCVAKKLQDFLVAVNSFKTEEDFFVYSSDLLQKVVKSVSSTEEYVDFTTRDMNEYNLNTKSNVASEKLYQEKNLDKTFVSFDLKSANYVSLVYAGVFGTVSEDYDYKTFMSEFTEFEHFKNSKNFRQTLFGNLCPKRQQKVQKFLVQGLYEVLGFDENTKVFSFTSDELVVEGDLSQVDLDTLKGTVFEDCVRVTEFVLEPCESTTGKMYYVKNFGQSFELKMVPKQYYTQAYKKVLNEDLTDSDLMFFQDGLLAKFLSPMFV